MSVQLICHSFDRFSRTMRSTVFIISPELTEGMLCVLMEAEGNMLNRSTCRGPSVHFNDAIALSGTSLPSDAVTWS